MPVPPFVLGLNPRVGGDPRYIWIGQFTPRCYVVDPCAKLLSSALRSLRTQLFIIVKLAKPASMPRSVVISMEASMFRHPAWIHCNWHGTIFLIRGEPAFSRSRESSRFLSTGAF